MDPLQAPIFHPSRSPQYLSDTDEEVKLEIRRQHRDRKRAEALNKLKRHKGKRAGTSKHQRHHGKRRHNMNISDVNSVSTLSDTDENSPDDSIDSDTEYDSETEQSLTLATARTPWQKMYVLTRDHILLPFVHGFFWGMAANIYRWIYLRWTRGPSYYAIRDSKRQQLSQSIKRQADGTGLGIGLGAM
ncbi:hypothetical protein BDF22DRAFT_774976 [Syncephalis plumigaleata]|nr:hypothetical protein BDF22DRAFT_659058 [Syncephalis plumigaleata]KAI8055534.1 hypothetical protein BDF22DRAFT_774976 [Syncephalis plumigaleata]